MALTGTEFADALKIYYLDPLNDQVYRATVMLDMLEKNSEDVEGSHAYVPLITARNPGVGSRKDTATSGPKLPTAGNQTYDAATFKMALHYGRASISGPVMRQSKTNRGAFTKALDVEMKGLMERLPEDLNRQIWAFGNGRAATISTTVGATSTQVEVYSSSVFNLKIGDRVAAADVSDGTIIGTSAVVTNIERDMTIAGVASTTLHRVTLGATIGAAFTTGDDTLYFAGGVSGSTPTSEDISRAQEIYGIPSLVDDGAMGADEDLATAALEMLDGSLSMGNIDRTAAGNAIIRSTVLQNPDGAGTLRPVTTALLEQGFLSCSVKGGAKEDSLIGITNAGLWTTIGLLSVGDRRLNDYKATLPGGWRAIEFNGRPVTYDRDCPRHVFWWLHMKDLMLLTQSGYELMDEDGKVLHRLSDRDAYEFTLYRDVQLAARRFNTHCKIDDLQAVNNVEADV